MGTLSLLCTKHYADPTTHALYKDSAWPYFEMLVSTLIKPADKAVNLPVALEWIGAQASDIASSHSIYQSNCSLFWLYEHVRRRERRLPVLPEQVNEDIVGKEATNGSDRQISIKKFKQTFDAVMAPAQKFQLSNIPGPTAIEWHLFLTKTLRSCTALVHVNLCDNEAIANVTLQVFSHLNDTLEHVDLSNCVGFGGSLQPLRRFLKLERFVLAGVSGIGREPASASSKAWSSCRLCRSSRDVCDTALAQAAFVDGRRRALDAEVRTEGGALVVGGCRVGRYRSELTLLWRAADCGQVQAARGLLAGRGRRGGVEVDRAKTDTGTTLLLQASTQGFVDVVKEDLQADLRHDNVYNPFSENSKKMIYELGNIEYFEIMRNGFQGTRKRLLPSSTKAPSASGKLVGFARRCSPRLSRHFAKRAMEQCAQPPFWRTALFFLRPSFVPMFAFAVVFSMFPVFLA